MEFFNIDYDVLVWQILPVRLRKPVTYAWLRSLIAPVKWLYSLFYQQRETNLYRLAHNSQVVYLEAVLNDTFDMLGRGIYIADGPFEDPLFTYLVPEDKPIWLGLDTEAGTTTYPSPQILFTDSETSLLGVGFIVMVPASVTFDMARLRAVVDYYRLAGRRQFDVATY